MPPTELADTPIWRQGGKTEIGHRSFAHDRAPPLRLHPTMLAVEGGPATDRPAVGSRNQARWLRAHGAPGERIRSAAWGWRASSQSGRMRHTGVGHRGCGSSRRTRPVRRCGGSKSSSGGSVHQTENRTTATRATMRTVAIPATSMMEARLWSNAMRHVRGGGRAAALIWTGAGDPSHPVDRPMSTCPRGRSPP